MATYTTELRNLITSGYDLGLSTYPIFDESYRDALNAKILNFYKFREIGFETPALFVDRLNNRMAYIMPYYNQLYNSAKLEISPLLNFSTSENNRKDNNTDNTQSLHGTSTANATNTDDATKHSSESSTKDISDSGTASVSESHKQVSSDTPEALLQMTDIEGNLYASNAEIRNSTRNDTKTDTQHNTDVVIHDETTHNEGAQSTTGENNQTGTANTTGWETFVKTLSGFSGVSQSVLLQQFRETFLNIDRLIIDELGDLFINLW